MNFSSTTVGGPSVTILASNDYQAVPIKISGEDVVKAGMPIKQDGSKVEAGTEAIGILLYDVDPKKNPNGAVVVDGIIDWAKCKASVGVSLTATAANMSKALPNIVFRDDIPEDSTKTYAGAGASEAV